MPHRRRQGLTLQPDQTGGIPAAAASMIRLLETDHLSDQLAALDWLRKRDYVRPNQIAVAGNSFGGIETLSGAERGSYCAAVDFSGGAESWAQAPELQTVMSRAARNSRAPIFYPATKRFRSFTGPDPLCRHEECRKAIRSKD